VMLHLTEQQVSHLRKFEEIELRPASLFELSSCLLFAGVIECYDLESGEWSTVERYPQDIWEHLCGTLYIPRSRDDMDVISEMSNIKT
jgi:predicted metalloenzyme YecM